MEKNPGEFEQSFKTRFRDRFLQKKFMSVLEHTDVETLSLRPWVLLFLFWQFANDFLLSFDPNVTSALL